MNAAQLFIEDTLVELPPRARFAITIKGIDVGNLASRDVSHTNSVKLPWTPTIQKLFGFAWNETSGATVVYQKLRCKLVQNGFETIPDGLCWVTGVDASGIQLALFENILDVFTSVQGRKLIELNLYTASGWNAADIDSARLATTGILNAVLSYGKPNGALVYNVNFWLPTYFYHEWVKGILQSTGLKLSGAILTDTNFLNLVVPYSFDKWEYPTGINKEYELTAPLAFLSFVYSSNVTTDGSTNFPATPTLGGGTTGTWEIQGDELVLKDTGHGSQRWLTLSASAVATNVGISAWAPGDVLTIRLEVYHPTLGYSYTWDFQFDEAILGPAPVFGGGTVNPATAVSIVVADGTRIRCRVEAASTPAGITIDMAVSGGPQTLGNLTAVVPVAIDRASVFWNLLMPDVNQTEILKDFAVRFGVLFRQVRETLYCKTLKEIIQDTAGAVDWTGKRVTGPGKEDSLVFSSTRYGQRTNFRYTEDSGAGTQPDNTAGMGTLAVPNESLDAERDYYTSPFECSRDGFSQVTLLVNHVYDSTSTAISDFKRTPGLRLGVLRSKAAGDPSMTFNVTARSDYKIVNFVHEETPGLQTCAWSYYLARYYAEMGTAMQRLRILTRWYNLTEQDIATFDRLKMIRDGSSYFIVQRIADWIPGTATKVELFKV